MKNHTHNAFMPRLKLLILGFLGVAMTAAYGEQLANKGSVIEVSVDGFKNDEGKAMIALHNTKKTFLKRAKPYGRAIVDIKDGRAFYAFKEIPAGKYAVAVFHDENENMDLDGNFLGIPKEWYGFSNNARRKFGPPRYRQAEFTLDEDHVSMQIQVHPALKDKDYKKLEEKHRQAKPSVSK